MDNKTLRPSGDDHWTKKKPGSIARGEKIHTAKLTPALIQAIKDEYASGTTTQKALADKHGVTQPQISRIVNDKRWAHIGIPLVTSSAPLSNYGNSGGNVSSDDNSGKLPT